MWIDIRGELTVAKHPQALLVSRQSTTREVSLENLQDWIVMSLPEKFCWSQSRPGELITFAAQTSSAQQILLLLQILAPESKNNQGGVVSLQTLLNEIQVESRVINHQAAWRLIINQEDQHAASCCLKNSGIAMATTWLEV